ncbi:MAG: YbaN family protein [Proteiniphilum sp.]|nr:YbaN family protein [Proteiniphilum sp.]MDD3909642.1 YbaN family protein [Proteiniphilum sp.]MDD4415186.1 YbaN family protein [Proteiniphilum sp.]
MGNGFNEHNRPVAHDISIALPEKKVKSEIKKNRITRGLYIAGGTLSLVLATLGIVVPGLPVTPLALLAAFLYAKSSEKLYNRLIDNKILGPRIKNYQGRKGITRKGKLGVIAFMSIMVSFSSFVVVSGGALRWVILSLGATGSIVVWFFVPTAKNDRSVTSNDNKYKSAS